MQKAELELLLRSTFWHAYIVTGALLVHQHRAEHHLDTQ